MLRFDTNILVASHIDGRSDFDIDSEGERFLRQHFHRRACHRRQVFLLERLPVEIVHQHAIRLVNDHRAADMPLDERARRLATAEAGHSDALRQSL